jgi:hypothetical protein
VSDWLEDLWDDIQKAFRKWFKGKRKPQKIKHITSEIDMAKNVTIRWTLPTKRTGGGDLPPEEIEHVICEMSADGGANYNEIGRVPPSDPQEITQTELDPGDWHFRFVLKDTLGQSSAAAHHVETVADDSPPLPIENITSEQT